MTMKRKVFIIALPFLAAAMLGACGTAAVPAPVETIEIESEVVQSPAEPEVVRPQTHRIKSGETLIEIATDYGLDYRELALWNGIADIDSIYIGDTLRLSPSPFAPATNPVVKNKSPVIISGSPPAAAAPKPAPTTPTTPANDNIANLPVKETPLAVKHPYSPQTLAGLQKNESASAQNNIPKPITPAAPVVKPPTTSANKPAILLAQRRRFGVDWSWPSAGAVIEKFSESNKGINIGGALGAPVYAGADGKVVYVGTGVKSYGRLVIIKHANDYLSAYAHNQTIEVSEGDKVERGQKIATLGDSGAPMPMLHFEIRKAGKPFDPLRVLPKL